MKVGFEIAAIGRVGREPTFRNVGESEKPVLSFSIAVDNGEEQEWMNIVLWQDAAESAHGAINTGDQVYVEGRGLVSHWEKDGESRTTIKITARTCQVIGKIGRRASSPTSNGNSPGRPPGKRSGASRNTVDSRGSDRGEPF